LWAKLRKKAHKALYFFADYLYYSVNQKNVAVKGDSPSVNLKNVAVNEDSPSVKLENVAVKGDLPQRKTWYS
jgi:hypothetical protein